MKNMIEICREFGIEIPAEKHADFNRVVAENYKTVAEVEKKLSRLTGDLSAEKARADAAEATLQGFEGKDFDAITRERDEWKRKHQEQAAAWQKEQEDRAFNETLSALISEARGRNPKAITALLDMEALRGSRNREQDMKAALEALRSECGYLFEDNGGHATFTGKKDSGTGEKPDMGKLSMAEYIAARKNK